MSTVDLLAFELRELDKAIEELSNRLSNASCFSEINLTDVYKLYKLGVRLKDAQMRVTVWASEIEVAIRDMA
jgi:hypothetical protein